MLLGLYGGTFNPVHLGHTHAALTVCSALGLAQVRMILSARPGHRNHPQVSALHRWQMLELACAEHPQLVPDDLELQRPGASYTVRTLEAIHALHDHAVACWILGQDSFVTLASWFDWQRLLDLANLIVLQRPGMMSAQPQVIEELCRRHETKVLRPDRQGQIYRLEMPMMQIASTTIRENIRRGVAVDDLLAEPVYTYIKKHKLYQNVEMAI